MKILPVILAMVLATPAAAQSVGECGDVVTARNLAEPWEENSATYANGDVRVAVIDTIEPAAAGFHLMVLSPPRNEIGDRQCRLIALSRAEGGGPVGFYGIDFQGRSADYDAAKGLVLQVPIKLFDPDTGGGKPAELTVTINQQTGEITAQAVE
ncbi:hypothetical protein MLD63_00925 (plasmid) [Paracoccus sp. TK19116]|uniref:Uncharacterized protein n=1 Tax=Paracoccus albicereus TaxID=2922394 RepID=A0ABT1ML22_9RHOB|nr:hypothetical protein [Paracoccus albicereus]MCQ0968997.1 hypothetical protein [Paracoccus albicereus]